MSISRYKWVFGLVILISAVAAIPAEAQSQPRPVMPTYTFFSVSGAKSTTGVSISDSGIVTGHYQDEANASHGFLWSAGGVVATFDPPDAGINPFTGTFPADINARGMITGYDFDNNNVAHGFLRPLSGTIVQFDMPEAGTYPTQGTFPWSINAQGVITGYYTDSNYVTHGFVRARNGDLTSFDAPGAGTGASQGTFAQDINSSGTIAGSFTDASGGYHGYTVDQSGTFTTFDGPAGNTYLITWAINDSSTATGSYKDLGGLTHSFTYTSSGVFSTFDVGGASDTFAQDINDNGLIAGYDYGEGFHAFLRGPSGAISNADPPNCVSPQVTGINRRGAIVGECTNTSSVVVGFVRTPGVPIELAGVSFLAQ